MSDLEDLPAIGQMAERGARFVLWRLEVRDGKATKIPLRVNGRMADSTRSASWATWEECERAAGGVPNVAGIGFVLAAERDAEAGQLPIVGIDLDGCRDPATGEIEGWASEVIVETNSYAEVSPSGTGVKVYAFADPVPRIEANKLVIKPANGLNGGKAQQIEIFVTERYFAITGQHLEGTPDEITDATEAFERLAARIARDARKRGGSGATAGGSAGEFPSEATMRRIVDDPTLAKLWRGEKDTVPPAASIGRSRARSAGLASPSMRSPAFCAGTRTGRSAAVRWQAVPPPAG
jgi:hypothetical protein